MFAIPNDLSVQILSDRMTKDLNLVGRLIWLFLSCHSSMFLSLCATLKFCIGIHRPSVFFATSLCLALRNSQFHKLLYVRSWFASAATSLRSLSSRQIGVQRDTGRVLKLNLATAAMMACSIASHVCAKSSPNDMLRSRPLDKSHVHFVAASRI